MRDFTQTSNGNSINIRHAEVVKKTANIQLTEMQKSGELWAIAKGLISKAIGNESMYKLVKQGLEALSATVEHCCNGESKLSEKTDETAVQNPLRVKTKGRTKIGGKRYKSRMEAQSKKARKE
jgi:hypothetical protein